MYVFDRRDGACQSLQRNQPLNGFIRYVFEQEFVPQGINHIVEAARIYQFFSLGKNHLLRRSKGGGYSVRLSLLLKD